MTFLAFLRDPTRPSLLFARGSGIVGLAVAVCAGCDDPREEQAAQRKQCNAVVVALNANAEVIRKYTGKGAAADPSDDAEAAQARFDLAREYDKISSTLGETKVDAPELQKHLADYRDLAKQAARAARGAGRALQKDASPENTAAANAAQGEFNAIVKRENALVSQINTYCRTLAPNH